jgi:hypothetical protein
MMAHDGHDGIGKLIEREQICADVSVPSSSFRIQPRQFARLVQDVFGIASFPMSCRRAALRCSQAVVHRLLQLRGKLRCVDLNSTDVAVRDLIFRIDGHRERFDRREVQLVDMPTWRFASSRRPIDVRNV